jgi:hypothetical protein
MGLVTIPALLASGTYRIREGALRPVGSATGAHQQSIRLDSPYLFVLDASIRPHFEEWYHRVGATVSYQIFAVLQRLPEFEDRHGLAVAFYWEQDLSGQAVEGSYTLNLSSIEGAPNPSLQRTPPG